MPRGQLPIHVQRLLEMRVLRICDGELLNELADLVRRGVIRAEQAISVVAGRQHGVVTWHQLRAIGLSEDQIDRALRDGRLHRLHRGVYLWGNPSPAKFAPELAAVLACGDDAYLGDRSATAAYDMTRPHDGPRHVTIVKRSVDIKGIATHRVNALHPDDHRTWQGIPIVSPARAIIELAATASASEVADAIEQGQIKRLLTKPALQAALVRAAQRPGTRIVRALLTDLAPTRSKAERLALKLLKEAKLPRPEVNHPVDGDEVDLVFEDLRFVLEIDSHTFHSTRAAQLRDRRRDADRERAGYAHMRAHYTELTDEPLAFIARTAAALARAQDRLQQRRG